MLNLIQLWERYDIYRLDIIWYDVSYYQEMLPFSIVTEDMLADLFTKVVSGAQDKRLAVRFYNDCVFGVLS